MANCNNCKAILWIKKRHYLDDGTLLCNNCYELFLEEKRKKEKSLNNLSNRILSRTYDIIPNFIDKYGIQPDNKILINLQKLLIKKYSFDVSINELIICLKIMKDKIIEERKIKIFENDLKYHKEKTFYCSKCSKQITKKVFEYSIDIFDEALCRKHQNEKRATLNAKKLYSELKKRGIECELEKNDGHKHIDLAIPKAKLYIEIDGSQHSTNPKQLESDLKRDYHSFKDGYITKRFTNYQIKKDLNNITEALVEVINKRIVENNEHINYGKYKLQIRNKEIDNL